MSFRYRVVDAFGATGEGTVRIGVLDGEANPSPVTFTDYVQVQAGEGNTIRVSPLANDIDPTAGPLDLTDVRPDLPGDARRRQRQPRVRAARRPHPRVDDTTVVIEAGAEPATLSFLYDVESSSGNTGRGLIVVKVVRESVPDYPVVADTVLDGRDPRGLRPRRRRARRQGDVVGRRRRDLDVRAVGRPGRCQRRRPASSRAPPGDEPDHPVRRHRRGARRAM